MRSVSRFQFCVYGRPACQPDLSAKWKHRQQCNTAWNATVICFEPETVQRFFPLTTHTESRSIYPCDSAHLAR